MEVLDYPFLYAANNIQLPNIMDMNFVMTILEEAEDHAHEQGWNGSLCLPRQL